MMGRVMYYEHARHDSGLDGDVQLGYRTPIEFELTYEKSSIPA